MQGMKRGGAMKTVYGCGGELRASNAHPYLGKTDILDRKKKKEIIRALNKGRENSKRDPLMVAYYYEVRNDKEPGVGLANAAKMILEHGTLKPWQYEGDPVHKKPETYDEYMSWAEDIQLFGYNGAEQIESGLIKIAYPSFFFSKRTDKRFPFAQMMMAIASEPCSAFSFYQSAKLVDIEYPEALRKLFPGQRWPHRRVREYLGLGSEDPIIGTIVKPKTGLTPELFSACVRDAALAGASFTKADENMHLPLKDVAKYVKRVTKDLATAGFDLGRGKKANGKRFIFAPHITTDPELMPSYAEAALEAGANALMFSPYYGGGFQLMAELIRTYDVPIYAHTAGMNIHTGSRFWGIDPRIMYVLNAHFGAAFMQIPAVNGYLKPDDTEKPTILEALRRNGLEGDTGMTLAIAGGVGPKNIGINLKQLGEQGRMLLAGTSVYSHPDGPREGVKALILAYRAYKDEGITNTEELKAYADKLKDRGKALSRALL